MKQSNHVYNTKVALNLLTKVLREDYKEALKEGTIPRERPKSLRELTPFPKERQGNQETNQKAAMCCKLD